MVLWLGQRYKRRSQSPRQTDPNTGCFFYQKSSNCLRMAKSLPKKWKWRKFESFNSNFHFFAILKHLELLVGTSKKAPCIIMSSCHHDHLSRVNREDPSNELEDKEATCTHQSLTVVLVISLIIIAKLKPLVVTLII